MYFFAGEIKGVMRVGLYAYNLLLRGRMEVHLVIMCAREYLWMQWMLYSFMDDLVDLRNFFRSSHKESFT